MPDKPQAPAPPPDDAKFEDKSADHITWEPDEEESDSEPKAEE